MASCARIALLLALALAALNSCADGVQHASPVSAGDKRSFADDHVRVLYCTSCGYQQNFAEVQRFLEDKYPHLTERVTGAHYQAGAVKTLLARAMGFVQLAMVALLIFGNRVFNMVGWQSSVLQKVLQNRLLCFGVVFLMGTLSQSLISTGAFEVYYNDELIFSKIQTGRWPTLEELAHLLEARGVNALY